VTTVWFGTKHPAEARPCPACGALVGRPCIALVGMPGTCVSEGLALTGMHIERVIADVPSEARA